MKLWKLPERLRNPKAVACTRDGYYNCGTQQNATALGACRGLFELAVTEVGDFLKRG